MRRYRQISPGSSLYTLDKMISKNESWGYFQLQIGNLCHPTAQGSDSVMSVIAKHRGSSCFRLTMIQVLAPSHCHSLRSALCSHLPAWPTARDPLCPQTSVPHGCVPRHLKGVSLPLPTAGSPSCSPFPRHCNKQNALHCLDQAWVHSQQEDWGQVFPFNHVTGSVLMPGGGWGHPNHGTTAEMVRNKESVVGKLDYKEINKFNYIKMLHFISPSSRKWKSNGLGRKTSCILK